MHADELETDARLVRRLLEAQLPEWAGLPVERIESSGTINALYRLGAAALVRLPRIDPGGGVERTARWLPVLEPLVPFELPVPLAVGESDEGYPWSWGVYPWLEGEHPVAGTEDERLARDLAKLVRVLRAIELPDAPLGRGVPLAEKDGSFRHYLPQLGGILDVDAVAAVWEAALRVPPWDGPPVWLHGDLMPANLLLRGDRLAAVIDWEGCGVGDPACDLMVAWNLLGPGARAVFRAQVGVDDATWERGRGWALATGIAALPYYRETNPELAANARYRIDEILREVSA